MKQICPVCNGEEAEKKIKQLTWAVEDLQSRYDRDREKREKAEQKVILLEARLKGKGVIKDDTE